MLTSLTGNFAPWGIQFRSGAALAVNEINRKGGVNGRLLNLSVADDESIPNGGIDGFRKLTRRSDVTRSAEWSAATSVSRPHGSPSRRRCAVPPPGGRRHDHHDREPLHVPDLSATRAGGRAADPRRRAGARRQERRGDRRRLRVGPGVQASDAGHVRRRVGIKLNIQVAPLPTTDFTPYLRALGNVGMIVATGHPPGGGAILAQAGQLGIKAPVIGAYSPFSLTAKAAGSSATGAGRIQCINVASKAYRHSPSATSGRPAERGLRGRGDAGLRIREGGGRGGRQGRHGPKKVSAYVHTHTFNIPGYAFPLRWTAWGELVGPTPFLAVLTKGPPPDAALNKAGDWWPRNLSKSKPLTPYRP